MGRAAAVWAILAWAPACVGDEATESCEPIEHAFMSADPSDLVERTPGSLKFESGRFTHGVYPGGIDGWESDIEEAGVEAYVDVVGRDVAWVYFSNNWFEEPTFPSATVDWIHESARVPWIRLMLRSAVYGVSGPDPSFSVERINAGDFDVQLRQWGQDAAAAGTPLIVEWGTEMNGVWFHWNASHNGGRDQGAQNFVLAYRRIVELISEGGADISWVFHADVNDDPDVCWNRFERYYPGDDVVDWIALSAYGQLQPEQEWESVDLMLDRAVPRVEIMAPGRPIVLAEFGMNHVRSEPEAAAYAGDAVADILAGRWPALVGFSWWNETWENDDDPTHDTDMRVQTGSVGPALAEALDDPRVAISFAPGD